MDKFCLVDLLILQAVTDFTQEDDVLWGYCRGRRLGGANAIDHFDHLKDHKGQQNEVNRDGNEVAIGKEGDACLFEGIKGTGHAIGYVAQHNKEVSEVQFSAK